MTTIQKFGTRDNLIHTEEKVIALVDGHIPKFIIKIIDVVRVWVA